jgi:High potential iron-sulfur protein
MQTRNRRVFMLHVVAGTTTLVVPAGVLAEAATETVKETDAYPKSMGYRFKSADVDKVKFPRHDVSQNCEGCQLYSAKPGDKLGTCSFFKRLVPPEGWCRNFKPRKAAA